MSYLALKPLGDAPPETLYQGATCRARPFQKQFEGLADIKTRGQISTSQALGEVNIPACLARWLVMCVDRVEGYRFTMAHQFLSVMLAVRRAGVTQSISALEERKLIKWTRGYVTILDLRALKAVAGDSYRVAEKEYKRLLGS